MRLTRNMMYGAIMFAIGLGALMLFIRHMGADRFFDLVRRASPGYMLGAVGVYALSWVFRSWRFLLLATHAKEHISQFDLLKINISGFALNSLFPGKIGDMAIVGYLKLRGVSLSKGAAIVLQLRILDVVVLIPLCLVGIISLLDKGLPSWLIPTVLCSALVGLIPVGIVVIDRRKRISVLFQKLVDRASNRTVKTVAHKMDKAYNAYHDIATTGRVLAGSLALSVIIWAIEGFSAYLISVALGAELSFLVILLAVALANVSKTVPLTPGGIAVYEGVMTLVLVGFGASYGIALVIAVLDHLTKKGFNLAIGLPATANFGLSMKQMWELKKAARLG